MTDLVDIKRVFVGNVDTAEETVVIDSDPSVVCSCDVSVEDINDSEELGIRELVVVLVLDESPGSRPVTLRKRGEFWCLKIISSRTSE